MCQSMRALFKRDYLISTHSYCNTIFLNSLKLLFLLYSSILLMASITPNCLGFKAHLYLLPFPHFPHLIKFISIDEVRLFDCHHQFQKALIKSFYSKPSNYTSPDTFSDPWSCTILCCQKKSSDDWNLGDFKSKSSPFYLFFPSPTCLHFLSVPLLYILRIMLSIRDERDEKHNSFILKELTMIAESQLIIK